MLPGDEQPLRGRTPAYTPTASGYDNMFNRAVAFLDNVKARFTQQPAKYERFLELLSGHWHGSPQTRRQNENRVRAQIVELLEGNDDLLQEFRQIINA